MTSCDGMYAFTCHTEKAERQNQLNGRNDCLLLQGHPEEPMTKPKSGEKSH